MAAALDEAAGALLSVWDTARERAGGQLSNSQLRALMVIEEFDGINLRGLGSRLGMLLSSASRLCDRLVAAGVLEREPGRLDRREISLHLTPAGQTLLDELRRDRRDRLGGVLREMSPAGRQSLLRGLWEFAAASRAAQSAVETAAPDATRADERPAADSAGAPELVTGSARPVPSVRAAGADEGDDNLQPAVGAA
ncbi:MAG TPA: MarR family transcriptional regulator [Micromonospora sp.]